METLGGRLTYKLRGQQLTVKLSTRDHERHPGFSLDVREEAAHGGRRLLMSIVPDEPLELIELVLDVTCAVGKGERAFLNGFQSWTESREFHPHESITPVSRVVRETLKAFSDYHLYNYSGKSGVLHGYTYSYVRRLDGSIALCGSLSEAGGYTQFEYLTASSQLFVRKDIAELTIDAPLLAFDLLFLRGEEGQVVPRYFDALGVKLTETRHRSGWTSWYNYFQKVTEKDILENLEQFSKRRLPIDLFQIDDGYQKAVGDWLIPNKKFPSGMDKLAGRIRDAGYGAGLWIAPFCVEKKSEVFQKHPDWIARDAQGRPIKGGFNPVWQCDIYTLDFDNEGARGYIKEVFDTTLGEWGYSMLKLDFLYAAALHHRKNRPRALVMREAMEFMRKIAGDKLLLGCGVPLAPSFGMVDYCRIGSDIHTKWEYRFLRFLGYRERASTVNSLTSTIGRRHMNERVFLNDPDVFNLRSDNNALNVEQKHTLFVLNALFGALLFTSDNIGKYSDREMQQYESLFPLKKKQIDDVMQTETRLDVRFRIDGRRYLSVTNLGGKPVTTKLPLGWLYSKTYGLEKGGRDHTCKPYETTVFHIVGDGVVDGAPLQALVQLAGTEGHVFPGAELARLDVENDVVTVELDPRCVARSALLLFVADDRPALVVNGVPHTVTTGAGARSGARWVRVELGSLPAPPARLPSAASSLDATSARARRSPEAMPPGPTEL